jgi:hypothetical protein
MVRPTVPFPTLRRKSGDVKMKQTREFRWAFVLFLLVALAAAQMPTQVSQQRMADVPFDFMVEQAIFPAGTYVVKLEADHTLDLRAQRGRESIRIAAEPIRNISHPGGAALVFTDEEGRLHLHQVWMNTTSGSELPASPLRTVKGSEVEVPTSQE